MKVTIQPAQKLWGEVLVPGDKSISHRSVILGALADGKTEIENFLFGQDCLSTIDIIRALGVEISRRDRKLTVRGGMDALREPENVLDAGNSGTTMRLMAGVLSGCPFFSVLTGYVQGSNVTYVFTGEGGSFDGGCTKGNTHSGCYHV